MFLTYLKTVWSKQKDVNQLWVAAIGTSVFWYIDKQRNLFEKLIVQFLVGCFLGLLFGVM